MMATVPHVTSGLGLRKFQADGFLLTRVYKYLYVCCVLCAYVESLKDCLTLLKSSTVAPGYNNIGLYVTWCVASYILWY